MFNDTRHFPPALNIRSPSHPRDWKRTLAAADLRQTDFSRFRRESASRRPLPDHQALRAATQTAAGLRYFAAAFSFSVWVRISRIQSPSEGVGNWQVSEIRQATINKEGKDRSTEERIFRPDSEGKLGEVSRTIRKESESAPGEKRSTVETYSIDVPGAARDGSLHIVERANTAQRTSSTGQQSTEEQVEQSNPGDPGSGLRVTILTTDTVRPGSSGAQATRTIQARDANDSFGIISVDTTKSDNIRAIQVQIAPSETPK